METDRNEPSFVRMALLDAKIVGAAVIEGICYMGWAAGGGVGGRYQEDSRLRNLLEQRRQLSALREAE